MKDTFSTNQTVSSPLTTPGITVKGSLTSGSCTLTLTSPSVAGATWSWTVELSSNQGSTWSTIYSATFQNGNGTERNRHGALIPLSGTYQISFEIPRNTVGDQVRVRVLTVTGGAWTISASMDT